MTNYTTEELAALIRGSDTWGIPIDEGWCADLCERAGLLKEWEESEDDFEQVLNRAAEILGVEIY